MIAKATLANTKGGLVHIGDSSIKSFLDDAVDDLMVRPHNEVGCMLGLEDGMVLSFRNRMFPALSMTLCWGWHLGWVDPHMG